MKKIFISIIAIALLVIISSCSPSSNKSSGDINSVSSVLYDISSMKYLKANVSSATTSIGCQSKTSRSLSSDGDLILVKQDGEDTVVTPLTFEVVNTKDENGDAVEGFDGEKLTFGQVFTQDAINGKLDKVYVTDDYTFVSYVTVDVEKLMQNTTSGNSGYIGTTEGNLNWWWSDSDDYIHVNYYDSSESCGDDIYYKQSRYDKSAPNESDGVSVYDVNGYYTNKFRASFIIDNNTGLIYSVGDLRLSLQNGVAIDSKIGPLSIKTNYDGSLDIEQLVANKDISVYRVFKDKYGQYYVLCDYSGKDGNIIYFTDMNEYIPTEQGEVLHLKVSGDKSRYLFKPKSYQSGGAAAISSINIVGKNFSENAITSQDYFTIYFGYYYGGPIYRLNESLSSYQSSTGNNNSDLSESRYYFEKVENGKLYLVKNIGGLAYIIVDISDYKNYQLNIGDYNIIAAIIDETSFVKAVEDTNNYTLHIGKINFDTTDITKWNCVFDASGNQIKYNYGEVEGKSVLYGENTLDSVSIGSSYEWYYDSGFTALEKTFIRKTPAGTTKYKIVKDKLSGDYEFIETSKYTTEKKTLTLQPINR